MDRVDSTSFRKALDAPVLREPQAELQALVLAAEDIDAVEEIAFEYLMAGAHDVARVLYGGLVVLAPRRVSVHLGLGLAWDRLGQTERAARAYERAAKTAPAHPMAYLNLAELHLRSNPRRAEAFLRAARKRTRPDTPLHLKVESLQALIRARSS